ncbi:hypothetical protein Gogos_008327 [Gossypium gossypioides]|uniref:HMA domain-containing protein n=1 Tax=Gossypium gossypioides TaxID=34282 RepID=A0A7J9CC70_GOSGO|nr:hypothetical protein [Gossypium gossypioides]
MKVERDVVIILYIRLLGSIEKRKLLHIPKSYTTLFIVSALFKNTMSKGQSTIESDSLFWLLQKTILSVELLCPKCRQKVMHVISELVGITSITLDPSKNTVMVTGEADPFKIIKKVRKFRKHASIVSIGAAKEEKKEEKKDEKKDSRKDVVIYSPKTCQRCEVWYVVHDDLYHHCSIL